MTRRTPDWSRLVRLLTDDDGRPVCQVADDCEVCCLAQRPDEPWTDYLRRMGDLYRASPDGLELYHASKRTRP